MSRTPLHLAAAICACLLPASHAGAADPLNAVLVGGGPDPASNAAQIESHVRFVASLLPPGANRRLLFADGKTDSATVSAADDSPLGLGRSALAVLLPNSGLDAPAILRKAELGGRPDGASSRDAVRRAFADLLPKIHTVDSGAPLLIYFAGHGARDEASGDVTYNLWNNENLSPRDLAFELARASAKKPIVLVMAQCYSGAFADALFRHADPKADLIPQNLVGFFSARKDRTASGCGVETAAADYQDFSSYFFGALCGRDRFGKPVESADYNHDGRVSLHEAFCYALGHDESFDTPVCTSDAFLERFASVPDEDVFTVSYAALQKAASLAQRAALDALSDRLGVSGEDRALTVYDRLTFQDPIGQPKLLEADRQAADNLSAVREKAREPLFHSWPDLRWAASDRFGEAVENAATALSLRPADCAEILAAARAHDDADAALDNEEAWLTRFANLARSIARARQLREHGSEVNKTRFQKLWDAENASLPLTAPPTVAR